MLTIADAVVDLTVVREVMPYVGVALIVVLARALRHAPANLLVLMLTAFVDMAGLFLIIPLLPFYVKLFHSNGETLFGMDIGVGFLTGLVVTAFTVAQLVTAPLWGRFSDRYGRRAAVAVALSASTAAYLLFGFADSLWMLLLSRVVQGAGGGLVGVIQAYVADSVEPAQRARALGWLSASTNLGVALGPFLGSCALDLKEVDLWPGEGAVVLGNAVPGVLAAALCVVNAVFALRYLKETAARQPKDRKRAPILAAVRQVLAHPRQPASRVILVYAIAIGTAHAINPLMALFLDERMGIDDKSIGYVFMYIGSISVFARVLLLGRSVDRLGEVQVSRIGVCSLATFFLLMPFVGSLGSLALVLAFQPIGMALTFPCLAALLSRLVPQSDRGMFMGVQQSFAGLVRVLAPLLYGNVFDLFSTSAPFWIAGGVVLTTLALGVGLQRAPKES